MRAQRLHAVALGGVVSGRQERDAAFAREVDGLFRDLAAHVGFDANAHCVLEVALRGAGAPRDATHSARRISYYERLAAQPRLDAGSEIADGGDVGPPVPTE